MAKRSGRARSLSWLALFIALPLAVWFAAARRRGFEGKSLSNLSLEPMVVVVSSCAVFVIWLVVGRGKLSPLLGVVLLVLLAAGAFALQHFVPGLRE